MNNNVNNTGKNEEIQNANFDEIERILTSDLEENIKELNNRIQKLQKTYR